MLDKAIEVLEKLEEKGFTAYIVGGFVRDYLIKRETTDEEQLKKLEDAIAFRNVSNMPARVKCALLAWHTLEDMLNKEVEKGSGNIDCCH